MPPPLRASLELDLQDKLTAGLRQIEEAMDRLRNVARTLGLGELEDALERLRTDKVDGLSDGFRVVESRANAAAAAVNRLAIANDNLARSGTSGLVAAPRLLAGPAAGGGGGGGAGGSGAGFGDDPRFLNGPDYDGRIPLNLRRSRGLNAVNAGRNLAGAGAGVFGATSHFGGAASEAMGGAMTAAMEGFAVYEPIKAYAGFENVLRHIAITEKLKGDAVDVEIKRLTGMFTRDALETGQSSESIARAYSDLVQMGISHSVIDKAISAHSHAATAYNISAEAIGPAVGALLQNMRIPEGDIGSALAAMAYASKEGRFKVEDFSRQLPGTSGYLSLLGMTGRHSADIGFAALETVMKNSAEPNQAAANFNDALHYITSPIARKSFAKGGIDLPKLLENAGKQGIDPLDAVLGKLNQKVAGMDPVKAAEYLGTLLHNQQAGMGVLSLLQHKGDYLNLVKTLDGVNKQTLDTDFKSAFAAPEVQLHKLTEQTEQLNRTLGAGFVPTIAIVGTALTGLLTPLTWLNENFPRFTHGLLATTGGFLLLAAGVGVFKVVAPLFVGAWSVITASLTFFGGVLEFIIALLGLLLTPIGLVVAAVAAVGVAVYEVYKHWSGVKAFFVQTWESTRTAFLDFELWAITWAMSFGDKISKSLSAIHFGFNMHMPFGPDSVLGRMFHLGDMPQISGKPSGQADGTAGVSGLPGSPSGTAAGRGDSLHITVAADPGTAVTGVQSSNPAHAIATQTPNPGRTLNRP